MMWGLGYNGARAYLGCGAGFFNGGFVLMILTLVVLTVAIVLLVLAYRRRRHDQDSDGSLDILKLRYAKGEIDEEEYQKKKMVLKG